MLKIIAIAVVALIVAVLIFAATRPDTFRVERSASIKAPPEKIFPLSMIFTNGRRGHRGKKLTLRQKLPSVEPPTA